MIEPARRAHALPAVLAAIAMVFALYERHAVIAWFTGAPRAPEPFAAASGSARAPSDDVDHYTCGMHPQIHLDHPGVCPLCGMQLVPVRRDDQASGTIHVDPARRGPLGIRTQRAAIAPLRVEIRAEGRLVVDETRLHDVTLKVSGYVTQLAVNATGQRVARGALLLTLYSPELYAAQQEYLGARAARDAGPVGDAAEAMLRAAETKLALWGFGPDQLRAITDSRQPIERVAFRAPASGVVIEKSVVEGAAVSAGQRLFRIADLDQIWVEADVHDSDLDRLHPGDAAHVTLSYLPGRAFDGKVAFVYPFLDPMARTGRVRIALANPKGELKPDMFATVTFAIALGDRLQVPTGAVVYTGPRRLVFVDLGDGRLRPQEVTLGARAGDAVEVLTGLAAGDVVVTSGNFLVAAESRIRATGALWEDAHVHP